MNLDVPPNPEGRPYFEIDFGDGRLQTRWISREEKDRADPRSRDCHFDLTNGTWLIRPEKGVEKGSPRPFPFGPALWELLLEVFFAAGEFARPVSQPYVYSEFYRLQRILGVPAKQMNRHWFIAERKPTYGVRLNPARTFRIIADAHLNGLPDEISHKQSERKAG